MFIPVLSMAKMGILTFPIKRFFLLWSSLLYVVQLPTHLLKAEADAALWCLRTPSYSPPPCPSRVSTSTVTILGPAPLASCLDSLSRFPCTQTQLQP